MSLPDVLLDATWSLYSVPAVDYEPSSLKALRSIPGTTETSKAAVTETLRQLSHECRDYLLSQDSVLANDLIDPGEKRGSLQECVISQLESHVTSTTTHQSAGLVVEIRFQRSTARAVLFRSRNATPQNKICPFGLILFKAPANYVRQIIAWLDFKFGIPTATPLKLAPELILNSCSRYLENLSRTWIFAGDDQGALEQSVVKQVVGNLKLTISVSETAKVEMEGKLKTIDLDLPHAAVYSILGRIRHKGLSGEAISTAFLEELREAIYQRTGLRLPLTSQSTQDEIDLASASPLKVTRISCAAFAIGIDGRLKFAKQPIEHAKSVGYEEAMVRSADWNLLEMIRGEAERQSAERSDAG